MNTQSSNQKAKQTLLEVNKLIVGKEEVLLKAMLAILAGGHILMEDIPGVGKTTMALGFSRALGLEYNRVQFTPDVLPSDIVGYSIYDKNTGEMSYQKGAILCNLFLADELNRATSRTQSALLQAMEEGRITVDNNTYELPSPFVVIATQNPSGAKGTQMLPDSQMDRFMVCLSIGYPSRKDEAEMLRRKQKGLGLDAVEQVLTHPELEAIRAEVDQVHIKDEVLDYIVSLITKTRNDRRIIQGASPRGSIALASLAKATAWMQGRDYVLPRDIAFIFNDCLSHRLIWDREHSTQADKDKVLAEILASVKKPAIS